MTSALESDSICAGCPSEARTRREPPRSISSNVWRSSTWVAVFFERKPPELLAGRGLEAEEVEPAVALAEAVDVARLDAGDVLVRKGLGRDVAHAGHGVLRQNSASDPAQEVRLAEAALAVQEESAKGRVAREVRELARRVEGHLVRLAHDVAGEVVSLVEDLFRRTRAGEALGGLGLRLGGSRGGGHRDVRVDLPLELRGIDAEGDREGALAAQLADRLAELLSEDALEEVLVKGRGDGDIERVLRDRDMRLLVEVAVNALGAGVLAEPLEHRIDKDRVFGRWTCVRGRCRFGFRVERTGSPGADALRGLGFALGAVLLASGCVGMTARCVTRVASG